MGILYQWLDVLLRSIGGNMVIYGEENRWSDFDWFLGKYDFFYQKYGHKFFAIRHKTILGIYDNFDNALADNISKGFPVGTFIVQECTGDESGYTVCVTSWRPA